MREYENNKMTFRCRCNKCNVHFLKFTKLRFNIFCNGNNQKSPSEIRTHEFQIRSERSNQSGLLDNQITDGKYL